MGSGGGEKGGVKITPPLVRCPPGRSQLLCDVNEDSRGGFSGAFSGALSGVVSGVAWGVVSEIARGGLVASIVASLVALRGVWWLRWAAVGCW